MNPAVFVAHLSSGGHWDGLLWVLRLVGLEVKRLLALFLTLNDLVAANGHQFGSMMNSGDLRTQVVLLLAEVEGVGNDLALKVAREADLDCAGALQILRLQIGKGRPWALCLVGHEVAVLVHTSATRFTTLRKCALRQVLGLKDLSNIVVFLGASDFAPEADSTSLSRCGKLLQ